ncbi:MAG: glycosyltransferase, partial [Deltaproteobacteria bacterium]
PPGPLRGVGVGVALRRALSQRHARRVADRFDVVVSAYNPVDFGRRAIQIIGDLSFDPALARRFDPLPPGLRGRFQASRVPRAAYRRLAAWVARPSGRDVLREDRVLANSRWVAEVMEEAYGVRPEVLYPPVPEALAPSGAVWERRAARFVAIGRFAPEKRLERLIAIVAGVRARGHDVALHLAGDPSGEYGRRIAAQARAAGDWVVLTGPVHGEAKARLLAGSRYGLHGREGEPFGIAVAELVRAGCVTFVPALGGPAEIVGDEALTWGDEADAVDRIDRMLRDPAALTDVRARLDARVTRFGTAAFVAGVRHAVAEELARKV